MAQPATTGSQHRYFRTRLRAIRHDSGDPRADKKSRRGKISPTEITYRERMSCAGRSGRSASLEDESRACCALRDFFARAFGVRFGLDNDASSDEEKDSSLPMKAL